ncbi:MAG: DNA polymerase domain-containing protein [Candidatus Sumerlaeia bacterium]
MIFNPQSEIRNPQSITGWLLDVYPSGGGVILWLVADDGRRVRFFDDFRPLFYVGRDRPSGDARRRLQAFIQRTAGLEWLGPARSRDFWSDEPVDVDAVAFTDLERADANLRRLSKVFPGASLFNCDIAPEVHYCYDRGLFPTARMRVELGDGGRLLNYEVLDDPFATVFELPGLREVELAAEGLFPGERPRLRSISLAHEGRAIHWDADDARAMLASLRDAIREIDPDLIWTSGGDSALMPVLLALAAQYKIDLGLDREKNIRRRIAMAGRTYMSYGQVLYHAPDYPLLGRWHIDRANSFWASQTGLDGLIEVARMARMPVQRAARRSIGTGITSIQLDLAYRQGYLIPYQKSRPEAWKTAALLLKSDRGGLTYQPRTGVYEDVVELDFVSMYPSIMVTCNVSPETLTTNFPGNADFLSGQTDPTDVIVPELDYRLSQRRRGLVPASIEPVIAKRIKYKALRKAAEEACDEPLRAAMDRRQEALKWLLVCCFGYLGYRNARFGRIEAHEATTALSREKLLQAREACEARGFEILHSIVDCVWIRKPGATDEEIKELCAAIDAATGLTIAVEGRYDWVVFLPSRQDPEIPVPARYFGRFNTGKLKFRGIEVRRHDQAPFVQAMQARLLEILSEARSVEACRALRPRLIEVVNETERALREHHVPIEQLLLKRKTSREAEDYAGNQMTAVAARQARRAGIPLHAGEAVRFIVTSAGDRDIDSRVRILPLLRAGETYDLDYYIKQLQNAAATVLEPLLGEPIGKILELKPLPRRRRPQPPSNVIQPTFL